MSGFAEALEQARDAGDLLSGGTFSQETAAELDGSGLDFRDCRFQSCRFRDCDFSGAAFYGCTFTDCLMERCRFPASYWKDCHLAPRQGPDHLHTGPDRAVGDLPGAERGRHQRPAGRGGGPDPGHPGGGVGRYHASPLFSS